MDQELTKIIEDVRFFISHIKGYKIMKAIVFGSRVTGNFLKTSDLDLILISNDFSDVPFTDRISRILEYYDFWPGHCSLEILCYTPAEFRKKCKQIGLVKDALEKGIQISLHRED